MSNKTDDKCKHCGKNIKPNKMRTYSLKFDCVFCNDKCYEAFRGFTEKDRVYTSGNVKES